MANSNHVQSLNRAFDLLELLCNSKGGMAIADLSSQTGLHKSTIHRLLRTMLSRGYVQQDLEGGLYYAGLHICMLSDRILENLDIVERARQPMKALSEITHETVHLVMLDGMETLYIYKLDGTQSGIRMASYIGLRRPMYCTSVGKALIATQKDDDILSYWNSTNIVPYTPNTIVDYKMFMREIYEIRERGFALDNEENELGVRCMAVSIKDWRGEANYAISISAPINRLSDDHVIAYLPDLFSTCERMAITLGG